MFSALTITCNNVVTKFRRVRAQAQNVLLMLPHCLQSSRCSKQVSADPAECERCGACPLADVLTLADKYGCQYYIAKGGREAAERVKRKDVRVVVAVACEKELSAGIVSALPKPVIAVPNRQPHGYCNDTVITAEEVEEALQRVIVQDGDSAG